MPWSRLLTIFALVLALAPGCGGSSRPDSQPRSGTSDTLQGGDISGGGNAMVCFDEESAPAEIRATGNLTPFLGRIASIEAYDLYEERLTRSFDGSAPAEPIALKPGETEWQYVDRVLKRVEPYFPGFARLMLETRERLGKNIHYARTRLAPIDDMNEEGQYDRSRCVLATAAANQLRGQKNAIRFDRALMEHPRHSRLSRAVLHLHELLYLALRRSIGQTDSSDTRILVAMLVTGNNGLSANTFMNALVSSDLPESHSLTAPLEFVWNEYHRLVERTRELLPSLFPLEKSEKTRRVKEAVAGPLARAPFPEFAGFPAEYTEAVGKYYDWNFRLLIGANADSAKDIKAFDKRASLLLDPFLNAALLLDYPDSPDFAIPGEK